ncbi:alpha/beta fold hydrolase [Aeromicrobium sp. 636]|uniref:Alpha/beta fold hydrolase n=1 Tax=Aeromicrobium senzhongii TaxID=2663859 RepID=A0A8I0EUP8_9ACTN|nr:MULTISPECIES: alpha/beta fold hydrolase [Aeromicrobium]MBC9225889.1 alpha/beta fold hydrolase [Aeromicrobium senzhongii]MCQ3997996.1 alpha/beta fold hydrolase [Aeromicrobium sp. 636]MTB87912.1 alpha/beta fold hydrolase [Aeromicrobium senzhongii]QNL95069.1 alpha/beta fold hydrolase [Aeromicrobium senzhongii]
MDAGQAREEDIAVSGELFAHLPSGLDLCHQTFGDPQDQPVLLIMGLGGPMTWWPEEFCRLLAGRGFHVIRYDNRDTGRSTKLRHHQVSRTDVVKAFLGRGTAPYGIDDLADDAVGLLDHLGIDAAHVVGVSMGGMIAQTMAVEHPSRVRSLTSIMSTTGRRTAGWIHPLVIRTMLAPAGRTRPEFAETSVRNGKVMASPAFPTPDDVAHARALETYDRGWIASGVSRHMLAVLTQSDRTERLRAVSVPTQVIHGSQDLLVHRSGGRATAAAIPGAALLEIAGMGHDLPAQLYGTFVDAIVANAERAR